MKLRSRDLFATIRTEGGLLPPDLIQRIAAGERGLKGVAADDYHLAEGERITEAVNRSWNRLVGAWAGFRTVLEKLPAEDVATSPTREKWLLILFQELGYGRLEAARSVELDGDAYPISHSWRQVPIHLVGARVDLDRRAKGVAGAARRSPHGLVQAFLNRSEKHLWGFASNGLRLRILRDSASLTRQAYVEFDLEAMMEGEIYSDFVVLWLLCHESRVDAEQPSEFWLERWSKTAEEQGTRALEALREGVQASIESLGRGFLAHPQNLRIREELRSGALPAQDFYRQLLRIVYRLLFMFVAEDRELIHAPNATPEARERYDRFYSTRRLRRLAERQRGAKHPDLYRALRLVFEKLGDDAGCPALGLFCLGSFLWSKESAPELARAELANRDLLEAVRALAFTRQDRRLRAVDYKNLGSEELGSVYESLLELHPKLNLEAATFSLEIAAGHERRTTGSYYTPTSLIQCLLDSALDPVLDEAAMKRNREQAVLELKVCDPACGSGHFLIAAAHRIARRLAVVRTGDEEPSPEVTRAALRDVIGRCLYGVDVNPMAVELCKVSLWLESLEPGKPLSFLEHRILVGNSLLGATPAMIENGIPDDAFVAIEGDDAGVARALRKQNREEREGQRSLLHEMAAEPRVRFETLSESVARLTSGDDATIAAIREKEARLRRLAASPEYQQARLLADAWCAAFVWRKTTGAPPPITEEVFRRLKREPAKVSAAVREEAVRLAEDYRFFHWHLAFPDVFRVPDTGDPESEVGGWNGGFDVVLGNPPWERVKLQEKEWFDERHPQIANAPNAAARKRLIEGLRAEDPSLYAQFQDALRVADAESGFFRRSGAYPLSGTGDVNTFAVFTELATRVVGVRGAVGLIIPTGLATDDQLKDFFATLIDDERLVALIGFENEEFFFPGIANVVRYCAITISGPSRQCPQPRFAFNIRNASQIHDEARYFTLTRDELMRLNPNTRTCPVFRTRFDADLTLTLYGRFSILRASRDAENLWSLSYMAMFHMANDSNLFLSEPHQGTLPLYEAKLFWHFDHRFGSYEHKGVLRGKGGRGLPEMPLACHQDPTYVIKPRYWVERRHVDHRLRGIWSTEWLLGFRKTASGKLERTLAASVLPRAAVNDKAPLIFLGGDNAARAHLFLSCLNSIVLDYIARQKVGGTDVGYFHLDQLPFPSPADFNDADDAFIRPRVLELTFTAEDVRPFAEEMGWGGKPFKWVPERRLAIQCELDAYFARLYGLSREQWLFVLDPHDVHGPSYPGESFRVLKEKEMQSLGEFRTKRLCLLVFDELEGAERSGRAYQTIVDPPPGSPRAAW